jgi:hypothetical protein
MNLCVDDDAVEICLILFEVGAGEGDGVYIDESRCEIKLGRHGRPGSKTQNSARPARFGPN